MKKKGQTRKGQNLIELVFVMPLLILILFGTIELAMFWKTANTVQELAFQAAANAANQLVLDNQDSNDYTDTNCTDGSCFNFAIAKAINTVKKKQGSLGVSNLTFYCKSVDGYGTRPYTLYECNSDQIVVTDKTLPKLKLVVDYRNPYRNGIAAQIVFQYKTLLLGAKFILPNGKTVTIIPRDLEISSTKVQQPAQY